MNEAEEKSPEHKKCRRDENLVYIFLACFGEVPGVSFRGRKLGVSGMIPDSSCTSNSGVTILVAMSAVIMMGGYCQ
jgi:hypothetical protein